MSKNPMYKEVGFTGGKTTIVYTDGIKDSKLADNSANTDSNDNTVSSADNANSDSTDEGNTVKAHKIVVKTILNVLMYTFFVFLAVLFISLAAGMYKGFTNNTGSVVDPNIFFNLVSVASFPY